MHMLITVTDEYVAIPVFGLNAGKERGALMLTSRSDSDTAQVSILSSVPDGTLQADQSLLNPTNVDQLAMVSTVLPAESGFVLDGVMLREVAYLAVDVTGTCNLDLSFVPNRMPVDIGRPGGFV